MYEVIWEVATDYYSTPLQQEIKEASMRPITMLLITHLSARALGPNIFHFIH